MSRRSSSFSLLTNSAANNNSLLSSGLQSIYQLSIDINGSLLVPNDNNSTNPVQLTQSIDNLHQVLHRNSNDNNNQLELCCTITGNHDANQRQKSRSWEIKKERKDKQETKVKEIQDFLRKNIGKTFEKPSSTNSKELLSGGSRLSSPNLSFQTNTDLDMDHSKPCCESQIQQQSISLPEGVSLTPEHINNYKRRQNEFDIVVSKLSETIVCQSNQNLKQISKYWSDLKHIGLKHFETKKIGYPLLEDQLKTYCSNKNIRIYLETNDDITAVLQVLLSTLNIMQDNFSHKSLSLAFDDEYKTTIESLNDQLDVIKSSYFDELSFIHERIFFYQNGLDEEKFARWIQTIQKDYPSLIERISEDFNTKIPRVEDILRQMLRNMKQRLLHSTI